MQQSLSLSDRVKNYINSPEVTWARLVSDILSPPVIWGALAFPMAFRDAESNEQALVWAMIYLLLVCLMPLIYVAVMVRRGKITDIHMQVRQQRLKPFLVSLLCTTVAWWTLRFLGAPPILPMLALFSLVQLTVMTVITLVWQVSMHAMSISGASVAVALMFGTTAALATVPFVLLVGAARLRLKRHTPAQVLVGTILGMAIPVALLTLSY